MKRGQPAGGAPVWARAVHQRVQTGPRRAASLVSRGRFCPQARGACGMRAPATDVHPPGLESCTVTVESRALTGGFIATLTCGPCDNHAVLRATLLGSPGAFGSASTTAAVLGSIVKRQKRLRGLALRLGRRLFSAKPEVFERRVAAWIPRKAAR